MGLVGVELQVHYRLIVTGRVFRFATSSVSALCSGGPFLFDWSARR